MVIALVVALLSGQVIYEWVDARGQSHFTNDQGSIPADAKRRATSGGALTVTPAVAKVDAGVVAPAPAVAATPAPDTCGPARVRVAQLEKQLEDSKSVPDQVQEQERKRCQEVLMVQGQGGFAQCMATRSQGGQPSEAMQKELEAARDVLRKAQIRGCR
ncbi:MAG: DUF4124 domain-containing protein [Archangium sp.]|nr:DUF4124 domain-containing protein [Archangium sp.]